MKECVNAIILDNKIIFENDRLITLFSEHKGRFNTIAKYAARSIKRFAGRLHPFNIVQVEIDFKNKLPKLIECHILEHFSNVHQDYNALLLLGYFKKLILATTQEHQENTLLYQSLIKTIKQLNKNTKKILYIKETFEIELLKNEGLWNDQSSTPSEIKKKLQTYCNLKLEDPQWL